MDPIPTFRVIKHNSMAYMLFEAGLALGSRSLKSVNGRVSYGNTNTTLAAMGTMIALLDFFLIDCRRTTQALPFESVAISACICFGHPSKPFLNCPSRKISSLLAINSSTSHWAHTNFPRNHSAAGLHNQTANAAGRLRDGYEPRDRERQSYSPGSSITPGWKDAMCNSGFSA